MTKVNVGCYLKVMGEVGLEAAIL